MRLSASSLDCFVANRGQGEVLPTWSMADGQACTTPADPESKAFPHAKQSKARSGAARVLQRAPTPPRPIGDGIGSPLPNGSRLSCGRNARRRKAVERHIKRLAGEATQFVSTCRAPGSFKR